MVILYFALGIFIAYLLHLGLNHLKTKKDERPEAWRGWLATGGLMALVLLLFRLGAIRLGSLYSGFLLLWPFIDRWRAARGAAAASPPPSSQGEMSAEEARQVLGVPAAASPEDIRKAHRRLIQRLHPDAGGSDYLARKLNEAREVLLGKHG